MSYLSPKLCCPIETYYHLVCNIKIQIWLDYTHGHLRGIIKSWLDYKTKYMYVLVPWQWPATTCVVWTGAGQSYSCYNGIFYMITLYTDDDYRTTHSTHSTQGQWWWCTRVMWIYMNGDSVNILVALYVPGWIWYWCGLSTDPHSIRQLKNRIKDIIYKKSSRNHYFIILGIIIDGAFDSS